MDCIYEAKVSDLARALLAVDVRVIEWETGLRDCDKTMKDIRTIIKEARRRGNF